MSQIRNNIILIGNLGADPEFRQTATGKMVARVSVATTNTYRDSKGEKQANTQWHRLVGWGAVAEYMQNYLKKGSKVGVLGKIKYVTYESEDGTQRNYTEIVVNEFHRFDLHSGMSE